MAHHEPFKALGPVEWDAIRRGNDDLGAFLAGTFSSAQTLIDSIPLPAGATPAQVQRVLAAAGTGTGAGGRARSHTDSAVRPLGTVEVNRALSGRPPQPSSGGAGGAGGGSSSNSSSSPEKAKAAKAAADAAAQLQREWKEVRINPRENPLGISVFKLSARDGRGSWFARRSIHEGLTFEKFKLGLEREFAEALKVHGEPGAGKVRGIGAERKVEHEIVEGTGKLEGLISSFFPLSVSLFL